MRHELRLTDIGEGLEEAEIITWLVEIGDEVSRDQPIVEVMTDKSNAELPAPSAGTVVALGEAAGSIVHVGDLLAVIDAAAAAQAESAEPTGPVPSLPSLPALPALSPLPSPPDAPATQPGATPRPSRPKASPSTRRAAAERGIDLTSIAGSGPGGRILLSDLDDPTPAHPAPPSAPVAHLEPQPETQPTPRTAVPSAGPKPMPAAPTAVSPPAPTPQQQSPGPGAFSVAAAAQSTVEPLRGVRRAIARNMTQSWSEVPHIHAFEHIDAEPLLDIRTRLKASGVPAYANITPVSFFVAAVARALTAFPQANATLDMGAGTITTHAEVNIGVAVAAPQGLVVPVVRDVGTMDFETLCVSLTNVIAAARQGTLMSADYQGGTATITNFGSLGGEQATPLIRPPESVIIGFGSIDRRPFVIDDELVARKTMHLVIGADHRLLDGDVTTAVLNHIAASLNDPLGLVL